MPLTFYINMLAAGACPSILFCCIHREDSEFGLKSSQSVRA